MDRARAVFNDRLDGASPQDLARPSRDTRWSNEQLLFHMLFGYLITRALLVVMRLVSRLPVPLRRGFASLLDTAKRPFDTVNYWGSCAGAKVFGHRRMGMRFDRAIESLQRRLAADSEAELRRSMPYPSRWDPFFPDVMTRAGLYRYPIQHFDFHRKQLTLTRAP